MKQVADRSNGPSLRSGFLRWAEHAPDSIAIVVRGNELSYGFVEDTARKWASAILSRLGFQPERVGVLAYRSEVAYIGTIAALMAGATFVPLNPTFPVERTASMMKAAELDAIIVDSTGAPQLATLVRDNVPLIFAPTLKKSSLPDLTAIVLDVECAQAAPSLSALPPLTPDTTAYLLFTSGSTGTPKGVPVAHENVVYFIRGMSERYRIEQDDRLSQTFDSTFDLSVFDMFMAWSNGARICSMATLDLLAPTKFVNRSNVTIWFSVPSVPAQMLSRNTLVPNCMPSLRLSLFCGEPLPRRSAEAWQRAAPNSILENLYGPTELTIACLAHRWDPSSSPAKCHNDIVPIGRPLDGLTALVLDDNLQPLPPGAQGELCVCGPQTTLGYWRDDQKTTERFVDLPVGRFEQRRFYRTGDCVFQIPSGEYVFVGRTDNQIKVLGHRVELGEIEAVLRRIPGVEEAVAIGWPVENGSAKGVLAFIVVSDVSTETIRMKAKQSLLPYMVPNQFVTVGQMPLNANGKVDRKALQTLIEQ